MGNSEHVSIPSVEKKQMDKAMQLLMSGFYLSQGSEDHVGYYHQLQYWLGMWDGIELSDRMESYLVDHLIAPPKHDPEKGGFSDNDRINKVVGHFRHIQFIRDFTTRMPEVARREREYLLPDVPFIRVVHMTTIERDYLDRPEGRPGRTRTEDKYQSFIKDFCIDRKRPLFADVTLPIFDLLIPEVERLHGYLEGKVILRGERSAAAEGLQRLATLWELRNPGRKFFSES